MLALKNSGDPRVLEALLSLLKNEDHRTRGDAAQGQGTLQQLAGRVVGAWSAQAVARGAPPEELQHLFRGVGTLLAEVAAKESLTPGAPIAAIGNEADSQLVDRQRQRVVDLDGAVASLDAAVQKQSVVNPREQIDVRSMCAHIFRQVLARGQLGKNMGANPLLIRIFAGHRIPHLVRDARILAIQVGADAPRFRDHLEAAVPGYAACFDRLWDSSIPWHLLRQFPTTAQLRGAGLTTICQSLRQAGIRFQQRTVQTVLDWADQATSGDIAAAQHLHIALALYDDRQQKTLEIQALERDIAARLAQTP